MTDLADEMRRKRERHGLSLREVADEAGVSFATLSRIERGCLPTPRIRAKLQAWADGLENPALDERVAKLEQQVARLLDMLLHHMANQ